MLNERKVAQMAAYFLSREGGRMPHLKLIKLLYLSDRECLRRHGYSMSGDKFVSMPHGPVLSATLDLINGYPAHATGEWADLIADKKNHEVELIKHDISPQQLDETSPAERDVLSSVWSEFGAMSKWEIRDWTHENCTEWANPNGSSKPIEFEDIFAAVGYSKHKAKLLAECVEEEEHIDRVFASL